VAQNGFELVVQQLWLLLQHTVFDPTVQAVVPLPQALAGACAFARLIPSEPRMPAVSVPVSSRKASRRGIGVARIRANSSIR